MQYPSIWNKREILLNNDHTGLEVMFAVPIAARFSEAEDSEKIKEIMYDQSSMVVVLNLKRLPFEHVAML
jgi:hypothetical protein